MKIRFSTPSHAKLIGKHLSKRFGIRLTQGYEWSAKILGYSSFKELKSLCSQGPALESDPSAYPDEGCAWSDVLARRDFQAAQLSRLAGIDLEIAGAAIEEIKPSAGFGRAAWSNPLKRYAGIDFLAKFPRLEFDSFNGEDGDPIQIDINGWLSSYADRINAYLFLEFIKDIEPTQNIPDWESIYYDEEYLCERFRFPEQEYCLASSPWMDHVFDLYEKETGDAIERERLYEKNEYQILNEIAAFLDYQNPELAIKNPILSKIPGITEIAKQSRMEEFRCRAEIILERDSIAVFYERFCSLDGFSEHWKGGLDCWISIEEDNGNISNSDPDMECMRILQYTAVFIHDQPNQKRSAIVAIINGHYIVPFRERTIADPDDFSYCLFHNSNDLNVVWKVIVGGYFSGNYMYSNMKDFVNGRKDSFEAQSFATVEAMVNPKYRGKRLLPSMLNAFSKIIGEVDSCLAQPSRQGNEENPGHILDNYPYDLLPGYLGRPGLFIFPVEGSSPGGRVIQTHLAYIPEKIKNQNVKFDGNREKRKAALTRYFTSLGDRLDHAEAIVFDPFDYPVT